MVWILIRFPNWMISNGKAKDGIYRRGCFSGFFFLFWCCEWKMKICITDHIFIFPFSFWIRKKQKDTRLPYSYFPLWNRRTKNERTVYTAHGGFSFILFSFCKRKIENGYNGSYFYFLFFVRGLEKRKGVLSYSFSIFYYEIEKRKTKGRYIHGPNQHIGTD